LRIAIVAGIAGAAIARLARIRIGCGALDVGQ
jgi:hypothetical protein